MSTTPRRLYLALPLALLFLFPVTALAQISGPDALPPMGPGRSDASRLLYDEELGMTALAKVEVTYEEEELCVQLALALEPRGLRPGNFNFVRFLNVDDDKRTHRLKIKFPKKAEAKNEHIGVWNACTEAPPALVNAETDTVQITIRQFTQGAQRPTEVFTLDYPSETRKSAVALSRDLNGRLVVSG